MNAHSLCQTPWHIPSDEWLSRYRVLRPPTIRIYKYVPLNTSSPDLPRSISVIARSISVGPPRYHMYTDGHCSSLDTSSSSSPLGLFVVVTISNVLCRHCLLVTVLQVSIYAGRHRRWLFALSSLPPSLRALELLRSMNAYIILTLQYTCEHGWLAIHLISSSCSCSISPFEFLKFGQNQHWQWTNDRSTLFLGLPGTASWCLYCSRSDCWRACKNTSSSLRGSGCGFSQYSLIIWSTERPLCGTKVNAKSDAWNERTRATGIWIL
jgi:hypothetical protein